MPELIILLDFEKENFSYNDLQNILNFVEDGCQIITASKSLFYLSKGKKQLDTGSFVQVIETVSDIVIPVYGKPSQIYFDNAKKYQEGDELKSSPGMVINSLMDIRNAQIKSCLSVLRLILS